MQTTTNGTLKQMKLKYENYMKLKVNVSDIDIFIKKYMDSEKVLGISVSIFNLFINIIQIAAAICCVVQAFIDLEKGLIIFFTLVVFTYIGRLINYDKQLEECYINIKECLLKIGNTKEKVREKNVKPYGQAIKMLEYLGMTDEENDENNTESIVKNEKKEITGSTENITDNPDEKAIAEMAFYDIFADIFDL